MATLEQLERALVSADKAGDSDGARKLAAVIARARKDASNLIPGAQLPGTETGPTDEPSSLDAVKGVGEAALTTVLAIPGLAMGGMNALNAIGGNVAKYATGRTDYQDVEQAFNEPMQAMTYAPRTETGRDILSGMATATAPLPGLGQEMALIARTAALAKPLTQATAARGAQAAQGAARSAADTVQQVPNKIMQSVGLRAESPTAGATGQQSAGAAAVPRDLIRAEKAASLPIPVSLTKGAETGDTGQLAFEKAQIKMPGGELLVDRSQLNRSQILGNFDAMVDATGAKLTSSPSSGGRVVKDVLMQGYESARRDTRAAFTKARNSPEAKAAVDPNTVVKIGNGEDEITKSVVGYLDDQFQGVKGLTEVTDAVRDVAKKMGIAVDGADGKLVALPSTVGEMEDFRRVISNIAKYDDLPGKRHETILKKIIDAQTADVSGPLYKAARAMRVKQARKYENRDVVAQLINNVRNMDDPRVAADQVFNKAILNSSPEEITFLRRVMLTSGKDGRQAWKEMQGSAMEHIKREATKGMNIDANDQPIVSPAKLHGAIDALDKNGRLDVIFGNKNAAQIRDLNDVVKYVQLVPPETLVNSSGSALSIMAAITEAGLTGAATGIPVPVLSAIKLAKAQIARNKTKLKVQEALNNKP